MSGNGGMAEEQDLALMVEQATRLAYYAEEHLVCLALDEFRHIIGMCIISKGSDKNCTIQTKTITRFLALTAASNYIIMHNHPNGIFAPSETDINSLRATDYLNEALGLKGLKEVVVGFGGCNVFDDENQKEYLWKDIEEAGYSYCEKGADEDEQ